MPATTNAPAGVSQVDFEALDSVLENLDLDATEEVVIEEIVEEEIEELAIDDMALRGVEAALVREEVYESQEVEGAAPVLEEDEDEAPAATTAAPVVKKTRKVGGASKPRQPRDLNALDDAAFLLEVNETPDKAATLARRPEQKKVAEKFDNLFLSLAGGKLPSVFVTMAFQLLDQKSEITSTDLVAAYKTVGSKNDTEGYDEGTARSQAGQIMNLFDAVKIATRNKQVLTLNANSDVARRLRDLIAAQ